jgi:hypothetical protein
MAVMTFTACGNKASATPTPPSTQPTVTVNPDVGGGDADTPVATGTPAPTEFPASGGSGPDAEPTQIPETTTAPEPTEAPNATPTAAPTQAPTPTESGSDTQRPSDDYVFSPEDLTSDANKVIADADKALGDNGMGMHLDNVIDNENVQGFLGLTPDQLAEYVKQAVVFSGAFMTNAHEIGFVQCKDPAAAKKVTELIAAGFDSHRWICVLPQQSIVTVAGDTVMLAVGQREHNTALYNSFSDLAQNTASEANEFFSFDAE